MKKLLMLGLVLVFIFSMISISHGADAKDVNKLINLMKSGEVKLWNKTYPLVVCIHENTGLHDHFLTLYKRHYALLKKEVGLTLLMRDYKEYGTLDARGFVLWVMVDDNRDGIVDKWHKEYIIIINEGDVLNPRYPEGYLNLDWLKMTREEAQKLFDAELKYILENIDKAKAE